MPRPLDEVRPGLPTSLNAIIQKAMAKDPAERYPSALDMANAIIAVRAELSGNAFASTASLTASAVNVVQAHAPKPVPVANERQIPWKPVAAAAAGLAILLVGWLAFARPSDASRTVAAATPDSSSVTVPVVQSGVAAPVVETTTTPPAEAVPTMPKKEIETAPKPPPSSEKKKAAERKRDEPKRTTKPVAKPVAPTRSTATSTTTSRPPAQTQTQPPTQSITLPTPQVVAPSVQENRPRIVVAPPPPPPPVRTPDPEPRPAPREEISTTVQSYARAIESRDIGAVRRAYPGITSDQARGFEQFFQSARSINVTFSVTGVEVNGNNADARLVGTYQYVTSDGKSERQPVSFSASLRYDGSSWRLTSVR
jgi:hypothetical protein